MPPRQRMPMGGMGPFMMGPYGNMGGRPPFGNMPMQSPYQGQGPMMGYPQSPMMNRPPRGQGNSSGGLLSKLLGKGNQRGAAGPAAAASRAGGASGAGGILKSLSNPGSINGLLNNTQQIIKTAQTIGPMVQQYGPLVKNLPAMWKLYRGLKDSNVETEQESKEKSVPVDAEAQSSNTDAKEIESLPKTSAKKNSSREEKNQKPPSRKGNSLPRLYI
ncbi:MULTISPECIES: YqfQ family protein [unclassified Bacillus (in: firmicutes)]|uniref:YqfQ family protein n=1 Tax=unclassified Bacillus (in: firmicutes) TaxID=185979 RepID=UPI0008E45CE6|nr:MULTISPECIES: YqfQ family protein [unclassified Bacillus (in: firmicutes)]SFA95877.1 YqfQ-like protein [Bacillus sp. UNCCL13]SFQ79431.1 YqfQ-like protein [Bacillus sp. cl95]